MWQLSCDRFNTVVQPFRDRRATVSRRLLFLDIRQKSFRILNWLSAPAHYHAPLSIDIDDIADSKATSTMVSLPMHEKQENRAFYPGNMQRPGLSRSRRLLLVSLPLVLLTWLLISHLSFDKTDSVVYQVKGHQSHHPTAHPPHKAVASKGNSSGLVPLEAHIMSKCPDARDCLRDLVVPAMEKVVDMVDFNVSFIGK